MIQSPLNFQPSCITSPVTRGRNEAKTHPSPMKRYFKDFDKSIIERIILIRLRQGATKTKAAKAGGIHRVTLQRWLGKDTPFAKAFQKAWEESTPKRSFQKWLHHPFRGKRPPTGKGTLAFPRYGTPRIKRRG